MIASRTGLAILTALALALGVIVALDTPRAAVVTSHRLFPGFDPARVVSLSLARGDETVTLARDDAGWRVTAPSPGPADAAAVDDVLGALELASWARQGGAAISAPRAVATASDDAGASYRLAIGDDGATDLTWADAGQGAVLVERWIAHALDRGVADLRDRAAIHVARPTGLELHLGGVDLVAQGAPLRALLPIGGFRLAPAEITALDDALAALRYLSFPSAPPPERVGTLRVLGGVAPDELDDLGPCPGVPTQRWLGAGCVDGAAYAALVDAARSIVTDPAGAVDPRPISASPVTALELGDAHAIFDRGDWSLTVDGADTPADEAALDRLVGALASPGKVVPASGTATAHVVVHHDDGTVDDLAITPAGLRRGDEPFAIAIDPALSLSPTHLIDTEVIAEEATALRRIEVREAGKTTTIDRGATLDRFTASTGAPDLAAIGELRDLTGSLRAASLGGAPPGASPRTLILTFDGPPVQQTADIVHTIVVDRACHATIDGDVAQLTAASCKTLRAPLVR